MITVEKKWTKKSHDRVLVVGIDADRDQLPGELEKGNKTFFTALNRDWENERIATENGKITTLTLMDEGEDLRGVIFVGLGKSEERTFPSLKEAFGAAIKTVNEQKETKVGVLLDTFCNDSFSVYTVTQAFADASLTASYRFDVYKTKTDEPLNYDYTLYTEEGESQAIREGIHHGRALGQGVNLARTLVNLPANDLTPGALVNEAEALANRYDDLSAEILDKEELESLGMHALLAVNRGSDQSAHMIVLRYQGEETWHSPLTLVGKGITYDSGGYSIKPGHGMKTMKSDMGGAGAVLGAFETIGRMQPEKNVMAVIPVTENLINGSAMKPGDVLSTFDGQTIEVTNTDAEGRLILADGVAYARHLGASQIVDVSTLTGSCVVALGDVITGTVANDDTFYNVFSKSAEKAGEPVWRFPTHPRFEEMVRSSHVADLENSPGREGGAITAGLFIKAFVHDTPWIHADVAGTAYLERETPHGPKGGTGVMVRTLAMLAHE
ncbi:leucyl aminopeptidase [Natribacillus halophilus]|uniref:Probable cytosol aminopeptidase n=1 Tax=Natribacillus halophilus TaxID=549003 RepID=A0A1G8RP49_9BACI|nr:leucyl aminopeptidase [Natribacillus halophilus]SDJ18709.1 leucyl aminopeptidase [Natribacillus halophilus]